MKTYNQFIKEANSLDNFIFAIDLRKASEEDINKLFDMATDYFDNFLTFNDDQVEDIKKLKPWSVVFNMYVTLSNNGKKYRTSLTKIMTPNWGAGHKHMEDIVTLKEFLEVGFENIENYIDIKNNTNKYNL